MANKRPRSPAAPKVGVDARIAPARWPVWLAAAVILAAAVAAYANSLHGVFLFGDRIAVKENPYIRSLWPPSQPLSMPLWHDGLPVSGRPLLSLSFALDYARGAKDLDGTPKVEAFHQTNLFIHVTAALLLLGLIRRSLLLPAFAGRYSRSAPWLAAAVALLWAVHPLQTESVTYIVQRAESLMSLFFLLTLYLSLRGFTARGRSWPWYAGAATACLLGQTVKEILVVAPFAVLLYDRQWAAGSVRQALRLRWRFYLALAGTWGAAAVMMAFASQKAGETFEEWPIETYLAMQPLALLKYLQLTFWPDKFVLVYEWRIDVPAWQLGVTWVLALALLAGVAWGLWRRKAWALPAAVALLILAPSSSFIPLMQTIHEHRMYLPLAAVLLLTVFACHRLGTRAVERRRISVEIACTWGGILVLAAAAGLAWRTAVRNEDYDSRLGFWQSNVRNRPAGGVGRANLAAALMTEGKLVEAVEENKRALECYRKDHFVANWLTTAHTDLARCYLQLGDVPATLASLDQARKHAVTDGEKVDVCTGYYLAYMRQTPPEADKALHFAAEAATLRRDFDTVRHLATAHLVKAQVAEAAALIDEASALRPRDAGAQADLAMFLWQAGVPHPAVRLLRKAIELDPANAQYRFVLEQWLAQPTPPPGRK